MTTPSAFLSHASENKGLAERIAIALQTNGVSTFFDAWEIRAGDSIRQRLEHGLETCTHFIVLLTPDSIVKPWVNLEIDAGIVRKIEGTSRFLPVRCGLAVKDLTVFLRTMRAPEITEAGFERDIKSLSNDIHGISERPPLGPSPLLLREVSRSTGLSESALRIAEYFVKESQWAYADPHRTVRELVGCLELPQDDVIDGIDELAPLGLLQVHRVLMGNNNHHVAPEPRLFAVFDSVWKSWNPRADAVTIAGRLLNNNGAGLNTSDIAAELGWDIRRLNPAIAVIIDERAALVGNEKSHPLLRRWMMANDETRRFVRRHG